MGRTNVLDISEPGTKEYLVTKTVAFDGSAGNGATGTVNLFTVTGDVLVKVIAVCTENLAGATATIAIGISGNTATFIAQTTATDIDAGHGWVDATPSNGENLTANYRFVANGADVIATVATANITDGTLKFYALFIPLSADGDVVAA